MEIIFLLIFFSHKYDLLIPKAVSDHYSLFLKCHVICRLFYCLQLLYTFIEYLEILPRDIVINLARIILLLIDNCHIVFTIKKIRYVEINISYDHLFVIQI